MSIATWARVVGASLVWLACGAQLHAQAEPSAVVTTVDPCVPIDQAHFRRLLSIELGTSIDYQAEVTHEPGRTWVHLSCMRGGIALQLQDGVTNKSMMRVLDAEPIANAERTRLVALAVAEFVVASWVELRAVPQPAVPAMGAQPPAQANRIAQATVERRLREVAPELVRTRPTWEIAVGGGGLTYWSHGMLMPLASLRLVQSAALPLAFVIGGDFGVVEVPVVRADGGSAGHINLMRASGIAALLFGDEFGDLSLFGGPGMRFGVIRMSSRAQLGGLKSLNSTDPHGGPMALGRLNYRFAEHFSVGLELELGVVTLPVIAEVEDDPLLEISKGWFSAGLGVSVTF